MKTIILMISIITFTIACGNENNYELYSFNNNIDSFDFFVDSKESFILKNNYEILDMIVDINKTSIFKLKDYDSKKEVLVTIINTNKSYKMIIKLSNKVNIIYPNLKLNHIINGNPYKL